MRDAEHEVINHAVNARLGTSINVEEGDYSQDLSSREMQDHPDLIATLRELLGQVERPTHIEWLVRCLPVHKVFDGSFLEDEFHRIEYASTLDGWGDTIWRSKMTGVENLIHRVLEDPEIEQRQKMFFVLAAPGRLPKDEARRHVLAFIACGPGVAAEAIRKIAEPEDLPTFKHLLSTKLDPWDRRRIETTVRQLEKSSATRGSCSEATPTRANLRRRSAVPKVVVG